MSKKVRIFIGSPGDVGPERSAASEIINIMNSTLGIVAHDVGVQLEVVRWETHAYPELGRPQGVINKQIGQIDIFVGIMWRRFGTPTGNAESGTEEEFRLAYESWKRTGSPHVMFYFSLKEAPPPTDVNELEQLRKVIEFRETLAQEALTWEFSTTAEFKEYLLSHLNNVISRIMTGKKASVTDLPTQPAGLTSDQFDDIARNTRVIITEVSPEDGYSEIGYEGTVAVISDVTKDADGWWSGDVVDHEGDKIFFFGFKFRTIGDDEPEPNKADAADT